MFILDNVMTTRNITFAGIANVIMRSATTIRWLGNKTLLLTLFTKSRF